MPNVARIVVSGSRPISGRNVTTYISAPKMPISTVAETSASQKFPVSPMVTTPT